MSLNELRQQDQEKRGKKLQFEVSMASLASSKIRIEATLKALKELNGSPALQPTDLTVGKNSSPDETSN